MATEWRQMIYGQKLESTWLSTIHQYLFFLRILAQIQRFSALSFTYGMGNTITKKCWILLRILLKNTKWYSNSSKARYFNVKIANLEIIGHMPFFYSSMAMYVSGFSGSQVLWFVCKLRLENVLIDQIFSSKCAKLPWLHVGYKKKL